MSAPAFSNAPTAFHAESPLDSLVRSTSHRRARAAPPHIQVIASPPEHEQDRVDLREQPSRHDERDDWQYPGATEQERYAFAVRGAGSQEYAYDDAHASSPVTPPPRSRGRPPSSPLLHTRFRTSTATNLTGLDSAMGDDAHESYYPRLRGGDDESMYSNSPSIALDPPRAFRPGARPDTIDDISAFYGDSYFVPGNTHVPAVVVSSASEPSGTRHGRMPSNLGNGPPPNFARPLGAQRASSDTARERPPIPPRTPSASSDKQAVLARNLHRSPSKPRLAPGDMTRGSPYASTSTAGSPSMSRSTLSPMPSPGASPRGPSHNALSPHDARHRSPASSRSPSPSASRSSSPGHSAPPSPLAIPSGFASSGASPWSPETPSTIASSPGGGADLSRKVTLSGRPPSPVRASSPVGSLYSSYSFYQLPGSGAPSPTSPNMPSGFSGPRTPSAPGAPSRLGMPTSGNEAGDGESTGPPGAEELLRLGIEHHEAMRLTESAACFEAAARDGKSGVGMLLWGLSLRHGWGTPRDERAAFRWLEKAARLTTGELEGAGTKARRRESKVGLQKELVLAIYEVGQCFFQGWGTAKDKVLAVNYFRKAAELGDPDAQQELAFCLANGKGTKKDRKEAAKWYRAAVAQGASDVGLAWIYKEKFMD